MDKAVFLLKLYTLSASVQLLLTFAYILPTAAVAYSCLLLPILSNLPNYEAHRSYKRRLAI